MLPNRTSFALVIAFISTFAQAGSLTSEWQTRYDNLAKVVRSKNFAIFQSLMADSYKWKTPDGKVKNRKESIAEFKPLFDMKSITGGEKVTAVSDKGSLTEVSYDEKWDFLSKDNKTSHYHEVGVDTWKQLRGKWQVVRTVTKLAEMK